MKQFTAFYRQHAARQYNLTAADFQNVGGGNLQLVESGRVGIGDRGTEVNGLDTRPMQRSHAHRTRLASRRDNATFQMDFPGSFTTESQRVDFGMCRDVRRRNNCIM